MKSVIESYVSIWAILLFTVLSTAFLGIHLNTIQARQICNSIKEEVQASNGAAVPAGNTGLTGNYDSDLAKLNAGKSPTDTDYVTKNNSYDYSYVIKRVVTTDARGAGETYIYNDIYKLELRYDYLVPIFGKISYPMEVYIY